MISGMDNGILVKLLYTTIDDRLQVGSMNTQLVFNRWDNYMYHVQLCGLFKRLIGKSNRIDNKKKSKKNQKDR